MSDPHWNYNIEGFPEDDRPWWRDRKAKNDEAYEALGQTGIEFRGWKFWPPFFCMSCGIPVNVRQWLFSRICGACDTGHAGMISRRLGLSFAGRVEKLPSRDGDDCIVKTFIDVRTPEGKRIAEHVRSVIHPTVSSRRLKPPLRGGL
jgi:hypothetical protein